MMRFTITLAALVLTAGVLNAQPAAARKGNFITADQLDAASLLPNPPAPGTPEGKAELGEVHRIQNARQAAQIAHAQADDAEEDMFIFKDVLGGKFTAESLPATALLSTHLHQDESVIVNPAKKFFERLRPFNQDATVLPICKTKADVKDYGYPSGHAATGYLEALALIMIVPEKRDAILSRADDYAYSRVVCGVHFPADGAASKSVAYAMMGLIANNPQFRKELAAAREETRKALGY